jgi:hypothetical protein
MMRTTAVALLFALCGCNFAVKHPAVTAGVVAGTVALGTCELASNDDKQCFITSGAVGIGLALVAAGALWLGSEDEEAPTKSSAPPKIDWSKVPDTTPTEPTKAPPPPADAGAPAPDAGSAAPPPDAGVVPTDA